jgi:hypothetical protein
MTAIVLNTYSYIRTGIIETVLKKVSETLTSVSRAMHVSRQLSANEQIARFMLHEYSDHTYASLLAELNRKTLQDTYND